MSSSKLFTAKKIQQTIRKYIEPNAQNIETTEVSKYLIKALEANPLMLVKGDSGIGKTTLLQKLFVRYARKCPSQKLVFMYAGQNTLTKVQNIQKPHDTVLWIDALDEEDEIRRNDEYLKDFVEKIKNMGFQNVIFSIRKQFFKKQSKENEVFSQASFFVCELDKFNEENAQKYIKNFLPKQQQAKAQKILQNDIIQHGNQAIFLRPLLLSFLQCKGDSKDCLIHKIRADKSYHISEIYELIIETWVNREKEVVKKAKTNDLESFAKDLAWHLYSKTSQNPNTQTMSIEEIKDKWQNYQESMPYEKDAQARSFLTRQSDERFVFMHDSFADFFLAQNLINCLHREEEFDFEQRPETLLFYNEMLWRYYTNTTDFLDSDKQAFCLDSKEGINSFMNKYCGTRPLRKKWTTHLLAFPTLALRAIALENIEELLKNEATYLHKSLENLLEILLQQNTQMWKLIAPNAQRIIENPALHLEFMKELREKDDKKKYCKTLAHYVVLEIAFFKTLLDPDNVNLDVDLQKLPILEQIILEVYNVYVKPYEDELRIVEWSGYLNTDVKEFQYLTNDGILKNNITFRNYYTQNLGLGVFARLNINTKLKQEYWYVDEKDMCLLKNCKHLKKLEVNTGYHDKTPIVTKYLNGLKNLEYLYIYNGIIKDTQPLESLLELEQLLLSSNNIDNINFLRNFKNLKELDLRDNQITDISPLEDLENLRELSLWDNQITDISPLKNLKNIEELHLSHNQITDISPLKNLKNLKHLYLEDNHIDNIDSLKYLIKLENLELENNKIEDISSLETLNKLEYCNLSHNPIQNFLPLINLNTLDSLDLEIKHHIDYSFLTKIKKLEWLALQVSNIQDFSFLQQISSLQSFYAVSQNIKDIYFVKYLIQIYELNLWNNQIVDISPLQNLKNVRYLDLSHNQIVDISSIQHLKNLRELRLNNNNINKVKLSNFDKLEILWLYNNPITEIYLSNFNKLSEIFLNDNTLTKVYIKDLGSLVNLRIYSDALKEIKLANVSNLQSIILDSTQLKNISSFTNLKKLKHLRIFKHLIPQKQIEELRKALPNCEINVE